MKKGFTLIETMVAVTIFVIVALIIAGITLNIVESLRRALAMKSVIDNLGFAMENMTQELREGKDYFADGSYLAFRNPENKIVAFKLQNDQIARCEGENLAECSINVSNFVPVTSARQVEVKELKFELTKPDQNNPKLVSYGKSYVRMFMEAEASAGPGKTTTFQLQTTSSQRNINSTLNLTPNP